MGGSGVILHRFTPAGIKEFRSHLEECRKSPSSGPPPELLTDLAFVEVCSPLIEIPIARFDTRGEAAAFLNSHLSPLSAESLMHDAGLWSWLTLNFFDSVCPLQNGMRIVRNDYHYIYEPGNVRNFYRHLLFVAWRILHLSPVHNRVFMDVKMSTLDKLTTEVMKRLYLTRIPCMFEVLERLYWEDSKGRPRPGITRSEIRAGDLTHRLPLRIRQLEKTYDLMSLNADQLIELLGEEFNFAAPARQR